MSYKRRRLSTIDSVPDPLMEAIEGRRKSSNFDIFPDPMKMVSNLLDDIEEENHTHHKRSTPRGRKTSLVNSYPSPT
jgi:hypothetical protein